MKNRIVIFVLLLSLMAAGAFSFGTVTGFASESSGRRIVTIVFDDSFSMDSENRYSNANYAIQAFIALLNEDDELHLVYMSDAARQLAAQPGNFDPSAIAQDIDLSDPQAGADQVRNNPWNGAGTPFGSIQIGYNELVSHTDTDPYAQYYLMVLSDGGFMDDATNQITIETAAVQALFESFYGTLMPNQTHMNTYYLAIGAEAVALTDRPDLNFHAQTASDGQSMIHAIGEMADEISGRYRLDPSEIHVQDTVVSFTCGLPLRSVAFLSMGREAAVAAITGPQGQRYEAERNVVLAPDGYNDDPLLFGNAILVQDEAENMPAGTWQVQFSSAVDAGSLTVMVEPAVECSLSVLYQGQELSPEALGGLLEGETVTVTAAAVESGTGQPIDSALLAEGTAWHLSYEVDGAEAAGVDGTQLEITLQGGQGRLLGTLNMPGFLPKRTEARFSVDNVSYSVRADRESMSARQNELDGCDPICFTILGNGEPLTGEAAQRYGLSKPQLSGGTLDYDWSETEEGTWLFTPKGSTDTVGDVTVTVSVEGLPETVAGLGLMELSTSAVIHITPKIEYGIETEAEQLSVRQNELDSCSPIRFYLTADGQRLTPEQAAQHPLSEPQLSGGSLEYQWYFEEETGAYVFQPLADTDFAGVVSIRTDCAELEAQGEAELTVTEKIRYEIRLLGEEPEQSVLQTELGGLEPFRFCITADGRPLTGQEVRELELELSAVFTDSTFFVWHTGERRAGFRKELNIEDDGTCSCRLSGRSWFYGTVELTLEQKQEASCTVSFEIRRQMLLYWIPVGLLVFALFMLWCVIGWIRQPKFGNQIMEIVVYTKFGTGIQESPRIRVMKRRIGLIPYKACRMRVGDLVFIAGDNRRILLDKDSVRGRVVYSGKVRFMGKSAGNMKRLLRLMEPAKRDIRMVRGMELYVASDKNAEAITGYRITSN